MKILFSPSETKDLQSPFYESLKPSLCFEELFEKRLEIIQKYNLFLQNATFEEKSKLLGVKKTKDIEAYKPLHVEKCGLQTAILRYNGVGYKYLDFLSLEDKAKKNILNSLLIFSNLLGVIKAGDKIPLYKLKQGESIDELNLAKYYKTHFSSSLDEILENELIIDLRAGFYEKFYTPKSPYICLKFLKNGKAVSHFAKAYRGIVARSLAICNPKNEEEFKKMPIEGLQIKEIQIKGKKTIYMYDIIA